MNHQDAKKLARRLGAFAKKHGQALPYSLCLEAIAELAGAANWQTLRARHSGVSLTNKALSGASASNFFELPFKNNETGWMKIEAVRVSNSHADYLEDKATYHLLYDVREELLEMLATEARGAALDSDEQEWLADEAESVLLDWGNEYEGEGLTVAELRGVTPLNPGAWLLKDGRVLEFYAPCRVELNN